MKTKFEEMTCCSWHTPRNAIVNIRTGVLIPREAIDRIPESKEKDMMLYSGNMCNPCAKKLLDGRKEPKAETIMMAFQTD